MSFTEVVDELSLSERFSSSVSVFLTNLNSSSGVVSEDFSDAGEGIIFIIGSSVDHKFSTVLGSRTLHRVD